MPSMTPAAAGSGTMSALAGSSRAESAAASGSGTMTGVAGASGSPLFCSELLACSESLACTDVDGINPAAASTGTMVHA